VVSNAIEFDRGLGKMFIGWRLLRLRHRGWLPAPKGNILILALLMPLGRDVVRPGLKGSVVAAAIAVGIALTSKPGQLSQQVHLPGEGIVIAVRAEYVVNH
jgi:hypothetical protein